MAYERDAKGLIAGRDDRGKHREHGERTGERNQ